MLSIALNIKDRPVTIIGGGSVALRKFKTLINEGAKVKVVAKDFIDGFMDQGAELIKDVYKKEYIEGAYLLFIASDDEELNAQIEMDAKALGVLYNRCDKSSSSDFISINMKKIGGIDVSISTSGRLPDLNKTIMDDLKKYDSYDDEYLDLASRLRSYYIHYQKQDMIKKIKQQEGIKISSEKLNKILHFIGAKIIRNRQSGIHEIA